MRNWNIEKIKSSNLPEEIKEIIIQEYNQTELSSNDPNNYSKRNLSYPEFKKMYHEYLGYLLQLLGEYYFYGDILHRRYIYSAVGRYEFEEIDLDDEELLEYVLDFYEDLNDKEILTTMKRLLDPNNSHIRIMPYEKDNPICREVRGRCIKPKDNSHIYASYYMRGTSEDLTILTHETGHMLSHALFGSEINPIINGFLSETESFLFEFLMNSYISKKLEKPELACYLEANRTAKTIDTIWNIRAQQILYRQLGKKPNMRRLNRIMTKEGCPVEYDITHFKDLTTFTLFELSHLLHSYFISLHFYKRITEDTEKGLHQFKVFMRSKKNNVYSLYEENNIDYDEIIELMDHMYQKAVTLKKKYN